MLIPGTSRSGATIIGGTLLGMSRKAATEFSFFCAIPTLLAATVYSLYKTHASLSAADWRPFGVGTAAAFVSAFLCVGWLRRYISTHDFTASAWYRIAFGLVVCRAAPTAAWCSGPIETAVASNSRARRLELSERIELTD